MVDLYIFNKLRRFRLCIPNYIKDTNDKQNIQNYNQYSLYQLSCVKSTDKLTKIFSKNIVPILKDTNLELSDVQSELNDVQSELSDVQSELSYVQSELNDIQLEQKDNKLLEKMKDTQSEQKDSAIQGQYTYNNLLKTILNYYLRTNY